MHLGIDLGTSYTKMGTVDEQGRFINLLGTEEMIPTVAVYVPRNDRLYFGRAAANLREPGMQMGKFFKIEMKRNPGYRLGPYSLSDITSRFLAWLWEQYGRSATTEAVESVTIGVPNYFGLKARSLVLEAVRGAFPGVPVRLVLEPLAALAGLLSEREQRNEPSLTGNILVVDIGGGTADFSLVHLGGGRGALAILEAQLQNGSDAFSGVEVDKAILRQVMFPRFEQETGQCIPPALKKEKGMTGEEEYQYTKMLARAEEIKLRLNERDRLQVDIPDFYRGYSLCTVLVKEDMVPVLENTLVRLEQILENAVKPRARRVGLYSGGRWGFDKVILTGGASRLEGVREVMAQLGAEILEPKAPEFYVVKGLSYLAVPGERQVGLGMRAIFPFRFYIEKLNPAAPGATDLEALPFDTANLELDPDRTYCLYSVACDSSYNLGKDEGVFRLRVYQGEDNDEDSSQVRADSESLVLDVCLPMESIGTERVDIYLDLAASCLRTSLDQIATEEEIAERDNQYLWKRALTCQEEMVSRAKKLEAARQKALENFAERVQDLKEEPAASYQNYDNLMVAKLLAFFELLDK